MIKAILLDLDDTLISNPLKNIGQRVDQWEAFFKSHIGRKTAYNDLEKALAAVMRNQQPTHSNLDVFTNTLTNLWQVETHQTDAIFRAFLDTVYAEIKASIQPKPTAIDLIAWCQQASIPIVIATNPIYTEDAILQRMAWGNLPTEPNTYALITTLDNMQFAKPTPHYYEEILCRLGITSQEALMVGDHWHNDMIAAEQAGLSTFWVRPEGTPRNNNQASPDGEGTLSNLYGLVSQDNWLEKLTPRPLLPSMIPARMLGNVGALFSLLREHAPENWWKQQDPAEWSPLEVVCHLRDSESSIQRPRLQRIATEDNPFLVGPQNPPGPGEFGCEIVNYCDPAETFAEERQKTVDFLNTLEEADWQRPARHSIFGPTSLLEMANFTTTHDRLHIQQICQTIGRCE